MSGDQVHTNPDRAAALGRRLDEAFVDALLKSGSLDELRSFRLLANAVKHDPAEATAFLEAFIDGLDDAIRLLEVRQ